METDKTVLSTSASTWASLLKAAAANTVQSAVSAKLASQLFDLATHPVGQRLPEQHMLSYPMPGGLEGDSASGPLEHRLGQEEGFDVAAMRLAAAAALGQLADKFSVLGQSSCDVCMAGAEAWCRVLSFLLLVEGSHWPCFRPPSAQGCQEGGLVLAVGWLHTWRHLLLLASLCTLST